MQVSLYVHLWQAVLMFIAGLVAVACSFAGFLRTGGADQLLRQALLSFLPTGGRANFDRVDFDFRKSKLTVYGLEHADIARGGSHVSGLYAEQCEILLDLWPRPEITAVNVRGMRKLNLRVERGFLQESEREVPKGPPFPISFEGVDCEARIGDGPVLKLKGCGGTLSRGPHKEMLGEFGLAELNGQPFQFRLACLADGRWEFSGTDLKINTQALRAPEPRPRKETFDPLELLVSSLLTGESEARGTVSLRVAVRPAGEGLPFACDGQVFYKDLMLRLPPLPADVSIPPFLDRIVGRQKAFFPRWLMADSITTGPDGCVAFHMRENHLEFACDEGPGSIITWSGGPEEASVEALKGSIETDSERRLQRVILRGFLGQHSNWELRMWRGGPDTRVFDVMVEPRVHRADEGGGEALWRFHSQIEDSSANPNAGEAGGPPLVKFSAELTSLHSPDAKWLPPGMHDFSGRFSLRGAVLPGPGAAPRAGQLVLDEISCESGGVDYGGPGSEPHVLTRRAYGPLLSALPYIWGSGAAAWSLRDVTLKGRAVFRFDSDFHWLGTEFSGWRLTSGKVLYRGAATDLGELGLRVDGEYKRETDQPKPKQSSFLFRVYPTTADGTPGDWSMSLVGVLSDEGDGLLRFDERNVPLKIHPERGHLDSKFISGPFDPRVSRKRELELKGGAATLTVLPFK